MLQFNLYLFKKYQNGIFRMPIVLVIIYSHYDAHTRQPYIY